MTIILPTRRGFLTGLSTLFVAPALVRATSLMPISAPTESIVSDLAFNGDLTIEMITREAFRLWQASHSFGHKSGISFAGERVYIPHKDQTVARFNIVRPRNFAVRRA